MKSKLKKLYLQSISICRLLAIPILLIEALLWVNTSQAASCPSSPTSTIIISSSCDTTIDINAANSPATLVIGGGAGVMTLGYGVYINNDGLINTFSNSGVISADQLSAGANAVFNAGTINIFTNTDAGEIQSGGGAQVVNASTGVINTFTNAGRIYSIPDIAVQNDGFIDVLNNSGLIKSDGYFAMSNSGRIYSLINSRTIVSNGNNAVSNSGTITSLVNSGSIAGLSYGVANNSSGVIGTLTNTGTITSDLNAGIYNWFAASIVTLNNSQGGSRGLTYEGKLPSNYNIIINSPTSYGKLAVTGGTGVTTFGIYSSSTVSNGTYAAVLSGLSSSNLTGTSGSYGSGTWLLTNSSGSIWDLIISGYYLGPSAANTQASLANSAQVLQGTYALQNSALANSFSYDCTVFGANNICVSGGARNTGVSADNGLNNTSALLIAAYRALPSVRIGAYADQNLSVNNGGSTVNLGNNTPLIGLFAAWNERQDGTGSEVKVSAAYGQKNTTVTRGVVGSGATASEAGSGSSQLNSQGFQVLGKHGFGVIQDVVVSPYVGIRYTQNNMGGYTEGTSSSVAAPLTYSALNTNATTALAGVGASYHFIPKAMVFASAGVETDTNTSNGTYSATGITGLTPINFNANPVKTRPTATLGAYYDVEKNQRLGITGIYRQEPYQAVSTTTVMATYTIGL